MKPLGSNALARLASALDDSTAFVDGQDPLEREAEAARAREARTIGRYLLLGEAGRGSGGCVYRAYDPLLRRLAAVKVLERTPWDVDVPEVFEREVVAMATLSHPNIVPIFDAGIAEGEAYFAMEWMEDGSLADQLARGPLSRALAMSYFEDVAAGLTEAHAAGLLHLDVKPSNVLLSDRGAHLADFGTVWRTLPEGDRPRSAPLGTPGFMPPEQREGRWSEVDRRADVYGLAATLAAMLADAPRGGGGQPADGLQRNDELTDVLRRARADAPESRYADVAALVDAVRSTASIAAPTAGRGRVRALGSSLAVAAVLALLWAFGRSTEQATVEQHLREGSYALVLERLGSLSIDAPVEVHRQRLRAEIGLWFDGFSYHPSDLMALDDWLLSSRIARTLDALVEQGDELARWLAEGGDAPATDGLSYEYALLRAVRRLDEAHTGGVEQELLTLRDAWPGRVEVRLLLALQRLIEEEYAGVPELLAGVQHPAAHGMTAVLALIDGRLSEAESGLLVAAGTFGVLRADLGLCRLLRDDLEGATGALEECVAAYPDSIAGWHHLAVARAQAGDADGALEALGVICDLAEDVEGPYPDGWDAEPATDFATSSRISYVLQWPSAIAIAQDPWLAGLRSEAPGYVDVADRLPR